MKKGISKQVFTYVVLLAVIALVAAYFLGYKKFADQATTLEASNISLQETVDALKVHHINKAQYEAEMTPMLEEVAGIMEKYPADTRQEDIIMHAVNTQLATPVIFSNINMGDKETLATVSKDVVLATNQESMQEEISFVEMKGTYVNELDYKGLKNVVQAVFDSKYNIGIDTITYARSNESGTLSGTVDLLFYSMRGNGKEYEVPNILPYASGTSNIFGVLNNEDILESAGYVINEDGTVEVGTTEEGTVEEGTGETGTTEEGTGTTEETGEVTENTENAE